jgi:hypothetical protein
VLKDCSSPLLQWIGTSCILEKYLNNRTTHNLLAPLAVCFNIFWYIVVVECFAFQVLGFLLLCYGMQNRIECSLQIPYIVSNCNRNGRSGSKRTETACVWRVVRLVRTMRPVDGVTVNRRVVFGGFHNIFPRLPEHFIQPTGRRLGFLGHIDYQYRRKLIEFECRFDPVISKRIAGIGEFILEISNNSSRCSGLLSTRMIFIGQTPIDFTQTRS